MEPQIQPKIDALSVDQLWDAVGLAKNANGSWALPGIQEEKSCPNDITHALMLGRSANGMEVDTTECESCHGKSFFVAKRDLDTLLLDAIDARWPDNHLAGRHGIWSFLPDCLREPHRGRADWFVGNSFHNVVAQALVAQGVELGGKEKP